jgi:hypothetical protein
MAERILFLTGHLARPRLEKVLARIDDAGFEWSIFDVGVKVAALMTEAIISRRVPRPVQADRILVPGRCRADLGRLSAEFGVRFERGPEELKDLPAYFGKQGRGLDLSRQDMRMFAEIVDASALTVDAILARAAAMRAAGADVIDLGCLPETPFPHLEDAVRELRAAGLVVSVDSAATEELRRAAKAGAALLMGLTEHTLDIRATAARRPCSFRPATATWRRCCGRPPPTRAAFRPSSTRSSIRSISGSRPRCNDTQSFDTDCLRRTF